MKAVCKKALALSMIEQVSIVVECVGVVVAAVSAAVAARQIASHRRLSLFDSRAEMIDYLRSCHSAVFANQTRLGLFLGNKDRERLGSLPTAGFVKMLILDNGRLREVVEFGESRFPDIDEHRLRECCQDMESRAEKMTMLFSGTVAKEAQEFLSSYHDTVTALYSYHIFLSSTKEGRPRVDDSILWGRFVSSLKRLVAAAKSLEDLGYIEAMKKQSAASPGLWKKS